MYSPEESVSTDPTFDARDVANFVLDTCESLGRPVTNLSLQKLVYFCHSLTLATTGKPLISERFEAWQHGPVMPYLYREFKAYGDAPIRSRATKLDKQTGGRMTARYSFSESLENLLRSITTTYSALTAYQLVQISHEPGGPWDVVWNHGKVLNAGMKISNDLIVAFHSRKSRSMAAQ